MTTPLSISEVERLVKERAEQLDRPLSADLVHVYEDPRESNGGALIVQVALRRPPNRKSWTEQRLRFSQSIRDALVESGDERYPLVQVFEPDEWADRGE